MIFKKQAIYRGIKYIRVAGEDYDYTEFIQNTRCEIYNCKYKDRYECIICNQVMKKLHANKINITLGYMPIE